MVKFARHLLATIPLVTLATSVVTAAVTGLWWIVAVGLVGAGIIAVQSSRAEDDEAPPTPTGRVFDLSKLEPGLAQKFQSLQQKRQKITNALETVRDHPALFALEIGEQVECLVESYYNLLLKLDRIRPFIDSSAEALVRRDIAILRSHLKDCSDEVAQENLRMALKNKMDEMTRLVQLQNYRKRIEAQLVNVISTLDSLHLRIAQLAVSQPGETDPGREISEGIQRLLVNLSLSEKVSDEIRKVMEEQPSGGHIPAAGPRQRGKRVSEE